MGEIKDLPGAEIEPTRDTPRGPVDIVKLPDGSRVIDRPSKAGPRTIETQDSEGDKSTETRFPEKEQETDS